MHDIAVDEEELGAAVALGAGGGVHGAAGGVGARVGVGEEDVFEGAELWKWCVSGNEFLRGACKGGKFTKKNAFAMKVYVKTVHPAHPPVPAPLFKVSETTNVTITPTNL